MKTETKPLTDIPVKLSERDGNAMMIVGRVRRALEDGGRVDLVDQFTDEALSGDYDHLLQTCFKYVDVR